jgi:general secretion pathway protein A
MDATHFGLRRRPFPATPDSTCYYPATGHERALAALLRGLADGEGVLLVTGEPGTGKTLLCHCLAERLGGDRQTVFLPCCRFADRAGLFQAVLFDLALPYEGRGEQEMRLTITDRLLTSYAAGSSTVLLADEAHHLSADLLEELRLLGNLEARGGKALQVVLFGLPSLAEQLKAPALAALRQRLVVKVRLEPLPPPEAADYLLHHLRAAGARAEDVFSEEALTLLARSTLGVPRLLNQAAHQAIRLAAEADAGQVDAEAALEALAAVGLEAVEAPEGAPEAPPADEAAGGADLLPLAAEGHAPPEPVRACRTGSTGPEAAEGAAASCRLLMTPRMA